MKKNVGILFVVFVAIAIIVFYLILCFGAYMYPIKYIEHIEIYCQKYNIDKSLVAGVISVESGFDANAVSPKGAKGLMQITDKTAVWLCEKLDEKYSAEKMFDPEFNIKLGCYYISYLSEKFKDFDTMLSAYNAGEGTVRVWLGQSEYSKDGIVIDNIPYKETRDYVQKVRFMQEKYQKRL